jgi:hypothetical protein
MNSDINQQPTKSKIAANPPSCPSQNEIPVASSSDRAVEFKLVVGYDDFGNGICAKTFLRWLVENFAGIINFTPHFLKFEELFRRYVRERLARKVAVADMVVIVARGDASLPDVVEKWVRTWETSAGINGLRLLALLSSSDPGNDGWTPVQSCLRQVARRANMKFVLQATPLYVAERTLADAAPATRQEAGEGRGRKRKSCGASRWPECAVPCSVAEGTTRDLPHTAVTDAIIQVLRARQTRTSPPLEMNQKQTQADACATKEKT